MRAKSPTGDRVQEVRRCCRTWMSSTARTWQFPVGVMQHVANVESSNNPYAIGVVGRAVWSAMPRNLPEALGHGAVCSRAAASTSRSASRRSTATKPRQVRVDVLRSGVPGVPKLQAGARILASCRAQAGE